MSVLDSRKHSRQKSEPVGLVWQVASLGLAGQGRLIDVSLTGLSVEITSTAFQGHAGITFQLAIPKVPAAPKQARLRWYRRVASRSTVFVCGLAFVQPYDKPWLDWMTAYMGQQDILSSANAAVTIEDIIALLKSTPS